ncbi:MAG: outer membrane beta-barrel protein, partial [Gammaproteobacteria bacterium]|nr:outer membrane beta-barrel protein [Gammaproteobacteria bacterium]
MFKTSLATAAVLILGLGATQAMAEINGFYGGAGIGVPDYAGGAKGIADNGGPEDDMDAIIGGEDGAWQGFIGYRFNRHWAVEAGYADLGHGVDDGQEGIPSDPEEYHANAWSLSLLGHAPVTERFSLYGKLGAAFWDVEREDTDTGIFNDDSDENGTGVVFGLGADYQVNRNMSLRASWDHYHDMGSKNDVDDPGNMGVSVISLNLMLHSDRALLGPAALGSGRNSGLYGGAGGGIADYDGLLCDGTPADCYNIGNDMDN